MTAEQLDRRHAVKLIAISSLGFTGLVGIVASLLALAA